MSSEIIQPLRGMQDLVGQDAKEWQFLENLFRSISQLSGYQEIRTPILESSAVFHRTLGESSDAVQKETYTFSDRGGESITLRPEGTAAVIRALLSNGMTHELPIKLCYMGPMFRYERPQKGRLRQFHQIGVESIGFSEPWADVDCISLGYELIKNLNLNSSIKLEINTLGDNESRNQHKIAFVEYLSRFRASLSSDSKIRLEKNPLRILDSKNPEDQKILLEAPKLIEFLNFESKKKFDSVLDGLSALGIYADVSPKLVRGFDYYSHTVFEFTTDLLGAQSAVLAGGRYNQLVAQMGGPETPCVGWAAGLERLHLLAKQNLQILTPPSIMIFPMGEGLVTQGLRIAAICRNLNIRSDIIANGKLTKRIQKSEKRGYGFIGIVGTTELEQNSISIKNLKSGEQTLVELSKISDYFLLQT